MPRLDPFSTLAIGSFPFERPAEALDAMGRYLDVPASPQMVRLSPWEDMLLGAVDGMPFVRADGEKRIISVPLENRESALASFYESYYLGDFSFLERRPESSLGFRPFLERAERDPDFGRGFLKTQVVGPLTFGQSVKVEGAFALVDDPNLLEAAAYALGAKAAWEAGKIRALGRFPVVFFDEPGLSGYGSAFSTISEETLLSALGKSLEALRSGGDVLAGCHVCGNTDWGLISRAGLDVVNFDAFSYLESVALYPAELAAFLEKGGYLAWGIVPTSAWDPLISAGDLSERLVRGFKTLENRGAPPRLLRSRALLTSSCGLGSLPVEIALAVLKLLSEVKERLLDSLGGVL
ncbi:MAG: hypothetical protein LBR53_13560 [Deltaproteobacteria bacterium]|jgi:hypothetical protein|nr:hypothetical protein [Deltaproteobacteria bacterium]